MKKGSLLCTGVTPVDGGFSGHANRWVMKRAQMQAVFSWP